MTLLTKFMTVLVNQYMYSITTYLKNPRYFTKMNRNLSKILYFQISLTFPCQVATLLSVLPRGNTVIEIYLPNDSAGLELNSTLLSIAQEI